MEFLISVFLSFIHDFVVILVCKFEEPRKKRSKLEAKEIGKHKRNKAR